MTTVHDDYPHPVPPIAYLRWKENYFFIVMDPQSEVFAAIHINSEPGFDRVRFSCHMTVEGELSEYSNEMAFPDNFAMARALTDGHMTVRFTEPHRRFDLVLDNDEISFDLTFEDSLPTFDYVACRWANPNIPSFQEVMTLGMNLPYNHQQQAMKVQGSVRPKSRGELKVSGYGYRDHSWCMRADISVASHTWSGHHFGNKAFGVKKLHTRSRPEVWAREGYVSDADGERALKEIEVLHEGKLSDGLPEVVRFELVDVLDNIFTIKCDVAGRHAQVPLVSEKASKLGAYSITENFCPAILEETGETGCSLVEIGKSAS